MAAKKKVTAGSRGVTPLEATYMKARRAGRVLNPAPGFKVTTPYKKKGSEWSLGYHTGEDHACPTGTPLVAVSYGHVIGVGWSALGWGASYGNMVVIEKAIGRFGASRDVTKDCQVALFEIVRDDHLHVNVTHKHATRTVRGWAGPAVLRRGFVTIAGSVTPRRPIPSDIRQMVFAAKN